MYFDAACVNDGIASGGLDSVCERELIRAMSGKPFNEMTLEEMFDFEARHSINIGRSVVTEEGFKRHQATLVKTRRGLLKSKKRRPAKATIA